MSEGTVKAREWWMDTDKLKAALEACDLGDAKPAWVRQYPHNDMLGGLTHVIEYSAYESAIKERDEARAEVSSMELKYRHWLKEYLAANARVKDLEIQIEHFHENKGWITQSALDKEKAKSARLVELIKLVRQRFTWMGVDSVTNHRTSAGDVARSSIIDIDKALAAYAEPQDEGKELK